MTLIIPGESSEQFLMAIRSPSSFQHLPPLQIPSPHMIRGVETLQQSIVERSGLKPGLYSSLNRETYKRVEVVYNELLAVLIEEISGLDVVDLTFALYEWLEVTLGHINKRRYESIPDLLIAAGPRASNRVHKMWQDLSPFTEAVRWLIEIAIKKCSNSHVCTTDGQIARLIALSRSLYLWDGVWEHIAHGVLPHTLEVKSDFTIEFGPDPRGMAALLAYEEAIVPWRNEHERKWMLSALAREVEATRTEVGSKDNARLDRAMETELGYNLKDWLNYSLGLIDSFDYHEYIKVMPKEELRAFLKSQRKVSPAAFESILLDHALSKESVSELSLDHIRPAEHARRDTRLFRRPVVLLEQYDGEPIFLYGLESVVTWTPRFEEQFSSGLIQLARVNDTGPVKKAIGYIQRTIGDYFRDDIFEKCREMGIESVKERDYAGNECIPSGVEFGPVDVLIVDRQSCRFVLVEVKNIADPGTVPKKMRSEMEGFLENIERLQRQADWFAVRIEALKNDFGLSPSEEYTLEGVIAINHPRLWMYASQESLPIVTDKDLFELLTKGERLVTPSAGVTPTLSGSGLYLPD